MKEDLEQQQTKEVGERRQKIPCLASFEGDSSTMSQQTEILFPPFQWVPML